MKTAKKILSFGPNIIICSFLFTAALAVALIPLLLLTKYAVPFFDDYGYSAPVWIHWMLGGFRLRGVISGALENTVRMWHTWQGTYSSIFLMGLNPMIFGEQYYVIGPVFLILNLVLSMFVFTLVTCRIFLKKSGVTVLGMFAAVTLFIILFLYSPQQGFYWFNGGIHYIGMFSFELYFLSVLILLVFGDSFSVIQNKKIPAVIYTVAGILLSVILGFFVAGANFVTTLQTMILLVSGLILSILYKKKRILFAIPSFISFGIGFYLNISAPGNAVRAAYFPDSPDALNAILLSFPESVKFLKQFMDLKTLLFLIILFPFCYELVKNTDSEKKLSFPVFGIPVLMLWSYCLYAACFTPGLYGTGAVNLARMINVIKITFQLLLVLNLTYLSGVLRTFWEKKTAPSDLNPDEPEEKAEIVSGAKNEKKEQTLRIPVIALLLWLILFALCFVTCKDRVGNYSVYGAYHYLADGEAKLFHAQYESRLQLLKTPETDLRFEPYSIRPWYLIWQDLSEDPGDDQNKELAYYYGKTSVAIQSTPIY